MELNRNQYFFVGVILLLVGLQLRMVQSYVLTEETTRFLAERSNHSSSNPVAALAIASDAPLGKKVVQPPEWLGWCSLSVGAVLALQSLAMRKPGGG